MNQPQGHPFPCCILFVTMAATFFSLASAEIHMPEPTIIADHTDSITDYLLWPLEEFSSLFISAFNTVLGFICLPFQYVTWFLLNSFEAMSAIPIFFITVFTNTVHFILCLPFVFVRDFVNAIFEGIICFPVNGITMLSNFIIHAPLNFIGIDIRPYLYYYIASIPVFLVNLFQGLINFMLNRLMFILVDTIVHRFIQWLLELPVWFLYHTLRFPVVLLEACVEITSSALSMLVSRTLMIVCSLLRLIVFVITYAVIFIGYWTLDIFVLLMTIAIGIVAWLMCVVILFSMYYSVRVFMKKDSAAAIAQRLLHMYGRIHNPSIKLVFEMIFELIPKELYVTLKDRLEELSVQDLEEEIVCGVCYEREDFVKLIPCGHNNVCKLCIEEIKRRSNICPMCRANIIMYV